MGGCRWLECQRFGSLPDLKIWTLRNFWERPSHPSIERWDGRPLENRQPISPDQRGTAPFRKTSTGFSTIGGESEILAAEPPHEDVPLGRPDELHGAGLAVVRSLAPEPYLLLSRTACEILTAFAY